MKRVWKRMGGRKGRSNQSLNYLVRSLKPSTPLLFLRSICISSFLFWTFFFTVNPHLTLIQPFILSIGGTEFLKKSMRQLPATCKISPIYLLLLIPAWSLCSLDFYFIFYIPFFLTHHIPKQLLDLFVHFSISQITKSIHAPSEKLISLAPQIKCHAPAFTSQPSTYP